MTELNSGTIIQAVKDDGQRTRESIRDMGQDIRDLPGNLATALAPLIDKGNGKHAEAGNQSPVWPLATVITVAALVLSYINGQITPVNRDIESITTSMAVEDQREEIETAQLSAFNERIHRLEGDRDILFTIQSTNNREKFQIILQENAALKLRLERAERK